MILTIDLTSEEERRVEQAKSQGFDVNAMLRGVIAGLPKAPEKVENRTEEIFAHWEAEAEAMSPEEAAAEDAAWVEIMHNIRQSSISLPIPDVSSHD